MVGSRWDAVFIVVDTNVLLHSIEQIERLVTHISSINMQLYVPRVVLGELDNLKKSSHAARGASRFLELQATRLNKKVCIEPASRHPAARDESNDDVILKACMGLPNCVLLTNDGNMRLKAGAQKIRCVDPAGKAPEALYREVINAIDEIEFMEYQMEGDELSRHEAQKSRAAEHLYRTKVKPVFVREVGASMVDHFIRDESSMTLDALLKIVLKHYSLFHSELPRGGRGVIEQVSRDLKKQDADVRDQLETLYLLFGLSPREIP